MPKVTYNPEPGDNDITEAFGTVFEAGKGVDVTDERTLEKLKGNPSFTVAGEKPEAEDKAAAENDRRLAQAIDGRTKAARERREKADAAEAEAAAAERARMAATALRDAREGGPEEPPLTNR